MQAEQLETCLENGAKLAASAVEQGYDLIALGDMGIGNTSTAAALLIASGFEAQSVVDRGTGISDDNLLQKREIIERAVEKHRPFADPKDILRKVGGFEFATMAGFILGLKERRVACVIDGFPVSSAAYMACRLDPQVRRFLFAGHRSKVKGHTVILNRLQLPPLVDLQMRLGEGTGAVLGGELIYLAAKLSSEMASFQSARVSRSETVEEDY
jgi:nicotinate-nucleotide--dimethylbenzimidazole phosphoribosyltransferase